MCLFAGETQGHEAEYVTSPVVLNQGCTLWYGVTPCLRDLSPEKQHCQQDREQDRTRRRGYHDEHDSSEGSELERERSHAPQAPL